jgi:hypothetical protein
MGLLMDTAYRSLKKPGKRLRRIMWESFLETNGTDLVSIIMAIIRITGVSGAMAGRMDKARNTVSY